MFRSTPAWSGRPRSCPRRASAGCFDPRPRGAGDTEPAATSSLTTVSIHARVERATSCSATVRRALSFRSTPAWSGRPARKRSPHPAACFDPRPRGAGDPVQRLPLERARVSIHARVERATTASTRTVNTKPVSIHARVERATGAAAHEAYRHLFRSTPAWSGRQPCRGKRWHGTCFDPRPRGAGDVDALSALRLAVVSIHARVERATRLHPSRGDSGEFRSTPAWSGRPSVCIIPPSSGSFDPRPRGAGDADAAHVVAVLVVSIHARVERATCATPMRSRASTSFDPRPRGAGDRK